MIRSILRAMIWLVPPAVYVAVFLVLEVEREAVFWTSVVFLGFSYVMLGLGFVWVPRSRIAANLAMPLVLVAGLYLAAELLVATFLIYGPAVSYTWVIVPQLVLAAVFLLVFLMTMSSNEAIAVDIETQYADVLVIKSAVSRITALERVARDPAVVRSLERLAEEFRYSPTMRSDAVRVLDVRIGARIDRLECLVRTCAASEEVVDQVAVVSAALSARNDEIKLRQ